MSFYDDDGYFDYFLYYAAESVSKAQRAFNSVIIPEDIRKCLRSLLSAQERLLELCKGDSNRARELARRREFENFYNI